MGGRKKTGKKEKKLRTYAIPKVFDCEKCSADQTLHINMYCLIHFRAKVLACSLSNFVLLNKLLKNNKCRSKKNNKKEAKIYCIKCKYMIKYDKVGALDSAIDIYNKWCEDIHNNNDKNYEGNDDFVDEVLDEEDDPGETL